MMLWQQILANSTLTSGTILDLFALLNLGCVISSTGNIILDSTNSIVLQDTTNSRIAIEKLTSNVVLLNSLDLVVPQEQVNTRVVKPIETYTIRDPNLEQVV